MFSLLDDLQLKKAYCELIISLNSLNMGNRILPTLLGVTVYSCNPSS